MFFPSLVVPVGQVTDPVFDDVVAGFVSVAPPVGVVTYSGPAVLHVELRSVVIGVAPGSVRVVSLGLSLSMWDLIHHVALIQTLFH